MTVGTQKNSIETDYEVVIGLEVHSQLLTKSKMFCSCSTNYANDAPNTHVCPVCMGMPGVLPIINRQAIDYTIMTALALNCTIPEYSKFDRKNYPYPDLMKGYQISQYDIPLSKNGYLTIEHHGQTRKIGITRVHLEEDTARLLHHDGISLIDVNRSGTPLMEIVSEPDMRSPEEARLYMQKLREILVYLGVSSGRMEEGSLRCDANVSVRPAGEDQFGTRTELKKLNSFRYVQKAIDYEMQRQINVIESGGRVVQETRLWNSVEERTVSMRSKEEAHDYRYFPEPDLPLLSIDEGSVNRLRRSLVELPEAKRTRFMREYALSEYDAGVLTATRALADFFEEAARLSGHPKLAANWVMGDLLRFYKDSAVDLKDLSKSPVSAAMVAELIRLVEDGTISGKIAKAVFEEMYRSSKQPGAIIKEKGLVQISDTGEIERAVDQVISENSKTVEQYRSGKTGSLGFFVGQVMKLTGGRANPQTVNEILRKKLAG